MTRQEVINEIKEKTANFDPSNYNGFLAIQVTLSDLNEPFYVEVKDGKLAVEPYEYTDRHANMIISTKDFIKMINGKLNSVLAFTTGKLKIEGSIEKAKELSELLKSSR